MIVRIGMSSTGNSVAIGGCRCTLHTTSRRACSAARWRSSSLVGARAPARRRPSRDTWTQVRSAQVGEAPSARRHPHPVVGDAGRDVAARADHEPGSRHRSPEVDHTFPDGISHAGVSPAAGRTTLRSVTSAVTRSAGVTSKAGLRPRAPVGAIRSSLMVEHLVLRSELDWHVRAARRLGVDG